MRNSQFAVRAGVSASAGRRFTAGALSLLLALGAVSSARADLAEVIAQAVAQSLNGLSGTEVQGESTTSVLGVDLTLRLLGFASCLPPAPMADPNPAPVPPANAYGCINDAQIAATVLPDQSGGVLTVTFGTLYVDLETRRDRTLYCGELGSGTIIRQGYLLSDCVAHADFTVITEDNCRQIQLGAITNELGPIDSHFGDSCLNTWAQIIAVMQDLFESSFDPYFQALFAEAVLAANPEICARTQVTDVPRAATVPLRLYPGEPNPFNPQTTIRFDLPAAGFARLSICDVAGRLVRTLIDGSLPQGSQETVWDGRDSGGREVGSGSYLARLEFGGNVVAVRLSLIR